LAQSLLQELQRAVGQEGRVARLITLYILQALATKALEDGGESLTLMEKAVRLAAPENYQRLFLDEGDAVGSILQSLRHIAPNFVTRLLRALTSTAAAPESKPAPPDAISKQEGTLVDSLGARELEVLRLVAEGLSNEAIGAKLFISAGTVKWYLNGIYHKLDVRNRTEAVACARQRHLL
jgi:LuxR family maltose regulon positive regulatory protein